MVMASDEDLEKTRNLAGVEKVKKLKEIEGKKKKELEEAEALLRLAQDEVSAEQEKKEKLPIPQVAATDISFLMTEAERAIFRTRRFAPEASLDKAETAASLEEQRLEEMAEEEIEKKEKLAVNPTYGAAFEQARSSIEQPKSLYGAPETVTGLSRSGEAQVKEFYDNVKGFYERGSDNVSNYYRSRTTTGVEERQEAEKKKNK